MLKAFTVHKLGQLGFHLHKNRQSQLIFSQKIEFLKGLFHALSFCARLLRLIRGLNAINSSKRFKTY